MTKPRAQILLPALFELPVFVLSDVQRFPLEKRMGHDPVRKHSICGQQLRLDLMNRNTKFDSVYRRTSSSVTRLTELTREQRTLFERLDVPVPV